MARAEILRAGERYESTQKQLVCVCVSQYATVHVRFFLIQLDEH